jgi:predicted nucleotidyltransferase
MEIGGLKKTLTDSIVRIVLEHKEPDKIILYGSRANGTHQKESDIDLAIFADNWNTNDTAIVRSNLEECPQTPLKFDVIHYQNLTKETLKSDIIKEGITLYDAKKH